MKISYECGPCFLRQAREAMDLSTDDENLKMETMEEIFKYLGGVFKEGTNSNKTGSMMHKIIKQKTVLMLLLILLRKITVNMQKILFLKI